MTRIRRKARPPARRSSCQTGGMAHYNFKKITVVPSAKVGGSRGLPSPPFSASRRGPGPQGGAGRGVAAAPASPPSPRRPA